ncbi:hypothetical protein [Actinoplanes sp. URMC 104]
MTRLAKARTRRTPPTRVTACLPKPAGVELHFLTGRRRRTIG